MARIVVYTHPMDRLFIWRAGWPPVIHGYFLCAGLRILGLRGHVYRIMREPKPVAADMAILHVDATYVDHDYLALASHFKHAVNFGAGDISKRKVSQSLLQPDDDWRGKVMVKSDLNYGGMVEARRNEEAARLGMPAPFPGAQGRASYDIFDGLSDVPDGVWRDDSLVVEKFMPETDPDGFAVRTWVFTGDKWSCMRHVAPHPVIKGHGVIKSERIEPTEALFRERERLGLQYGKFDYVEYEGKTVLLDANKTPGPASVPRRIRWMEGRNVADGLEGIMKTRI